MYICKYKILTDFNLVAAKADRQTAKFNPPPNFPAIQYIYIAMYIPRKFGGELKFGSLVVYLCNHQIKIHQY